jgi:hypothetical protein
MYFNNLKKKYAISCFIRYYLSQIKACNVQHNNESKNVMLILNKSHSHTNASFFFFFFQTSMVISSIEHNQISKIKFYIILNVKKKKKGREEKYKD